MTTRIVVLAAALVMVACDSMPGTSAALPHSISVVCRVTVSDGSQKDVETEYLPRVLWCETSTLSTSTAFLWAKAVAARSFLYHQLAQGGSPGDQLHQAASCEGPVPQIYHEAVAKTQRLVMLRRDGRVHAGLFHLGQSSVCHQPAGSCQGEPCMGLQEAIACSTGGFEWKAILDLFYDDPMVVQAVGDCPAATGATVDRRTGGPGSTSDPGPVAGPTADPGLAASDPGPTSAPISQGTCSYNGHDGTCQPNTQPCDGGLYDGLCDDAPGNVYCCLPPGATTSSAPTSPSPTTDYGSCTHGGQTGTCQSTSTSCSGTYVSGLCPGPSEIKCCVPPAPTTDYGSCTHGPDSGTCQSTSTFCSGMYQPGLCPGPADIQCCLSTVST